LLLVQHPLSRASDLRPLPVPARFLKELLLKQ
jgi:hypothetical protein